MRVDRTIFAGLDTLRVASPMPSAGSRPGDRRSRFRGRGVELADYRPYTPGDDLRLVVVVDASASMGFGEPRKADHAAEVAACLAFLALKTRDRVRVVVTPG